MTELKHLLGCRCTANSVVSQQELRVFSPSPVLQLWIHSMSGRQCSLNTEVTYKDYGRARLLSARYNPIGTETVVALGVWKSRRPVASLVQAATSFRLDQFAALASLKKDRTEPSQQRGSATRRYFVGGLYGTIATFHGAPRLVATSVFFRPLAAY